MANTGNVIVTERDVNPDSSTYNTTRTRKYQDFQRCAPDTGNFKAVTFASDNTPTIIECGHLNSTSLTRRDVQDRNCVSAVIGDCTTKTGAMNWPYDYSNNLVGTFQSCSSLGTVYISDTVTEIGTYTFKNCTSLSDVHFGNSVTKIGVSAFQGCTSLASVTIPNTVTSISDGAFSVSGLTSIIIPNNVTSIGANSFYQCENLLSVTIPASVEDIYSYAFKNCSNLISVTCLATTPPVLHNDANPFENTNDCPIYVPSQSLETYRTTNRWSIYASRFQAIQTP